MSKQPKKKPTVKVKSKELDENETRKRMGAQKKPKRKT
jgi:hypothetical protein